MADESFEQAHGLFAQAFCAVFTDALGSICATSWQLTTVDTLLAPAVDDARSLEYSLTFAGNLSGSCFVMFDRTEAEVLAQVADSGPARDYSEVLAEVMHQAASSLVTRLAPVAGAFTVEIAHAVSADPAAVHRAQLLAVDDEGRSATIRLFFSPDLSEALARPSAGEAAGAGKRARGGRLGNLNLVMDVELAVTLRFGQRHLSLREILDLGSGSIVELDRQVDEPVELILDGRVIARGEAVIIDGNYGVRVTEVLEPVGA
jgi:flagellar motor switch protein FliN/FliY